jgi:hypothetical protein
MFVIERRYEPFLFVFVNAYVRSKHHMDNYALRTLQLKLWLSLRAIITFRAAINSLLIRWSDMWPLGPDTKHLWISLLLEIRQKKHLGS